MEHSNINVHFSKHVIIGLIANHFKIVLHASDACKHKMHTCKIILHVCKDKMHACKIVLHVCKDKMHTCKIVFHACKDKMHACKIILHVCKDKMHACKIVLHVCKDKMHTCKIVFHACKDNKHICKYNSNFNYIECSNFVLTTILNLFRIVILTIFADVVTLS